MSLWLRSRWRSVEWLRRWRRRVLIWHDIKAMGYDVVPLHKLGNHGPILSDKGMAQIDEAMKEIKHPDEEG